MLGGILANIATPTWFIPNPQLYDFSRWAADVWDSGLTDVPAIATEERWRDWADYLSSTAVGLQYGLPGSDGYDTWKDWAVRVYQVTM